MMKTIFVLILVAANLAGLPCFAQSQFKLDQRVKLGGEGGWDYLTYDPAGQRLFITRGSHVMVVDTRALKLAGDIPDLSGIHGVALVQDQNRGFITNGGDNTVTIFDLKTLKKLGSVKVGDRPDAIFYEPFSKMVFSFNARSHDATAIDPTSGKVVDNVDLGGKPEVPASDGKGKFYVTLEDKSQIAQVDVAKLSVVKTWPTAPCQEPSAMAFDVAHHRLFAGCDNKMMVVVDSDSGKVVATAPIGDGVDSAAFNPKTQQILMSCGEGVLTVIHEDTPDKYTVQQNVATVKGARTMALDEGNNIAYLVTAQREDKPTAPGQRPPLVPGSFELLVVKPQ